MNYDINNYLNCYHRYTYFGVHLKSTLHADRVDAEVYARNQMVTKNATLSNENLELKNQMLSSNNDVSSHAKRNANTF